MERISNLTEFVTLLSEMVLPIVKDAPLEYLQRFLSIAFVTKDWSVFMELTSHLTEFVTLLSEMMLPLVKDAPLEYLQRFL